MQGPRLPFNRAELTGAELRYVTEAIESLRIASNGPFSKRCAALLEEALGVPRVLLTTSCSDALEMCAWLLDLEPGDEVIVPSFAFVTTASAFLQRSATPVFVDICPETLNIDTQMVAERITERTRAIIAVHYGGVGCDLDRLAKFEERHGVRLIEDNAHGLFATYRGKPLGTFGSLATVSFHETKNLTCGEGGALLINDPELIERAEIVWEKGTDRARFLRGIVDKYTWVDSGSSYGMSDILAAFLCAQLEGWREIHARRKAIWERYQVELEAWAVQRGVQQPRVPEFCESTHHLYSLLLPSARMRDDLIAHLDRRGISAVFHFVPLHLSAVGRKLGGRPGDLPVTEQVSERLVRLPLYAGLAEQDQRRIIDAVLAFGE